MCLTGFIGAKILVGNLYFGLCASTTKPTNNVFKADTVDLSRLLWDLYENPLPQALCFIRVVHISIFSILYIHQKLAI